VNINNLRKAEKSLLPLATIDDQWFGIGSPSYIILPYLIGIPPNVIRDNYARPAYHVMLLSRVALITATAYYMVIMSELVHVGYINATGIH